MLFEPILEHLPKGVHPLVVRYPTDRPNSTQDLLKAIESSLPDEDFVIVAESFSGPLALKVAGVKPRGLRGLVLCATFAECPVPRLLASLLSLGVRAVHPKIRMPKWILRQCLLQGASTELLDMFRVTLDSVSAPALSSRLKILAMYDRSFAPTVIDLPALYVRATRDRIVGLRELDRLRKRLPRLSTAEVDAPHLVLQCRPEAAVEIIGQFLQAI